MMIEEEVVYTKDQTCYRWKWCYVMCWYAFDRFRIGLDHLGVFRLWDHNNPMSKISSRHDSLDLAMKHLADNITTLPEFRGFQLCKEEDKPEPIAWVYNKDKAFYCKGYWVFNPENCNAIDYVFTKCHPSEADSEDVIFTGTIDQCFKYAEQYINNHRNK